MTFGLRDLFELSVRPNPKASNPAAYLARQVEKRWSLRWPGLRVQGPSSSTCETALIRHEVLSWIP